MRVLLDQPPTQSSRLAAPTGATESQARVHDDLEKMIVRRRSGSQATHGYTGESSALHPRSRNVLPRSSTSTTFIRRNIAFPSFNSEPETETLDVPERQQILRLLVKEILVDAESKTLRHAHASYHQPPVSAPVLQTDFQRGQTQSALSAVPTSSYHPRPT